jgi:hypothetical protein
MTTDNKYNGWHNYATWRIALEIFDNFDATGYSHEPHILAEQLKDYADEIIFMDIAPNNNSLAIDYAGAFLQEVNWYEIAEHIIDNEEGEAQSEEDYDETA